MENPLKSCNSTSIITPSNFSIDISCLFVEVIAELQCGAHVLLLIASRRIGKFPHFLIYTLNWISLAKNPHPSFSPWYGERLEFEELSDFTHGRSTAMRSLPGIISVHARDFTDAQDHHTWGGWHKGGLELVRLQKCQPTGPQTQKQFPFRISFVENLLELLTHLRELKFCCQAQQGYFQN